MAWRMGRSGSPWEPDDGLPEPCAELSLRWGSGAGGRAGRVGVGSVDGLAWHCIRGQRSIGGGRVWWQG